MSLTVRARGCGCGSEATRRERGSERASKQEKIEENLQCRIAAHSRASILSFGPVHRNLHGKLPREERARGDARNLGERTSELCRANCKQNKVSVSGDYGVESSGGAVCVGSGGVVEIAGYRKAGPKEI